MSESLNQELEFAEEWLSLSRYQFKIIALATILADDKKAYRGNLEDLCNCLGIGNSSANRRKIRGILQDLADNEYIKLIEDKDIYTISLSASIQKSKKITKIKKAWYELIKENSNNGAPSWENTLRVFLILIDMTTIQITTYDEIGKRLGLSKTTIQNCIKVLKKIKFDNFAIETRVIKEKLDNGGYRTIGQEYMQVINFE